MPEMRPSNVAAVTVGRLIAAVRRSPRVVLVVVVVLLASATGAYAFVSTRGLPDDAAFAVDGDVVTADEVEVRMKSLQALYGIKQPEGTDERDSFRRDTAKSMAMELLVRDAAADADIVVPGKAVRDALAKLVEKAYPGTGRAGFVQALGEMGASEQQVRDEMEQQILVGRLFDHVTRDVQVDDKDLRREFEDRRDELADPERRLLRNIVVDTRAEAGRVLRQLQSGASFDRVAAQTSLDGATRDKGGRLGWATAEDLADKYATAAFGAGKGQLFGPVKTQHGWNVGLVERFEVPKPPTFGEVRDEVRVLVTGERSVAVWTEWLRSLIEDADIEYADDFRPANPNEVPEVDLRPGGLGQ